jgi:hypothetical protein
MKRKRNTRTGQRRARLVAARGGLFGGGGLAQDIELVDGDAPVEVGTLVEQQLELAHSLGLALEHVEGVKAITEAKLNGEQTTKKKKMNDEERVREGWKDICVELTSSG